MNCIKVFVLEYVLLYIVYIFFSYFILGFYYYYGKNQIIKALDNDFTLKEKKTKRKLCVVQVFLINCRSIIFILGLNVIKKPVA